MRHPLTLSQGLIFRLKSEHYCHAAACRELIPGAEGCYLYDYLKLLAGLQLEVPDVGQSSLLV